MSIAKNQIYFSEISLFIFTIAKDCSAMRVFSIIAILSSAFVTLLLMDSVVSLSSYCLEISYSAVAVSWADFVLMLVWRY